MEAPRDTCAARSPTAGPGLARRRHEQISCPRTPAVPTFGELAPILAVIGYEPVPIRPGTKAPTLERWQDGHPVERYLGAGCYWWGIGILTRRTPAADLDVRSRPIARALVELADEMIGGAPVRFGQRPKALLPFSTDAPFEKVATRWFGLPGEDWTAAGYKANRVEVLGDGQQFVAYAAHPGTGRPYRWCRGDLLTQAAVDLPYVDRTLAEGFVAAAERVLLACGAVPLRRARKIYVVDQPRPEPTRIAEHSESRSGPAGTAWQQPGAEAIAKRISADAYLTTAGWRVRCPVHQGESRNSLAIADAGDGEHIVAYCFAGCAWAEIAAALERACR